MEPGREAATLIGLVSVALGVRTGEHQRNIRALMAMRCNPEPRRICHLGAYEAWTIATFQSDSIEGGAQAMHWRGLRRRYPVCLQYSLCESPALGLPGQGVACF